MATKKSTSGKTASKAKATPKSAKAKTTAKASRAKSKAVEAEVKDQAVAEGESDCKHAWLIEPPNGPTSDGSCTICGLKREFRNSYEYTPSWTARSGKAGAAKGAAAKGAAAKSAGTTKSSK